MNSVIAKNIKERRTIHDFEVGRMPPRQDILAAIELSIWAPNHYSTEPWTFYLIGRETSKKICRLNADMLRKIRGDEVAERKFERWMDIPGWLLLTTKASKNKIRAMEDYAACCCAAQNLMLYLWSIDIGMKWTTGGVTRNAEFFQILGIDPEKESVVGLFWYGYAETVPKVERNPLGEKLIELA